jgi:hypothetical protein
VFDPMPFRPANAFSALMANMDIITDSLTETELPDVNPEITPGT